MQDYAYEYYATLSDIKRASDKNCFISSSVQSSVEVVGEKSSRQYMDTGCRARYRSNTKVQQMIIKQSHVMAFLFDLAREVLGAKSLFFMQINNPSLYVYTGRHRSL